MSDTAERARANGQDATCVCVTCKDEAVPMRVRRIDAGRGLALCEADDGGRTSVETALVEPVRIGDVLLVHAGTAIAYGAAA